MAPVIVMIHGMWCGAWVWDRWRGLLTARGFAVQTPTLRHHGQPPGEPADPRLGTTSLRDYADDLVELVATLPEPPIVIGHSLGGLLAQMLAARGLLRAAALLMPAAPAGISSLRPSVLRAFGSVYRTWGFWHRALRPTFDEAAYAILNALPEPEQRAIWRRFVPESGRVISEIGFWPLDPRRAAVVDVSRVRCPLLVVAGGRDRITPAAIVRKVAARYGATASCHVFPQQAHWIAGGDGWREVTDHVTGWLDRFRGRAAEEGGHGRAAMW